MTTQHTRSNDMFKQAMALTKDVVTDPLDIKGAVARYLHAGNEPGWAARNLDTATLEALDPMLNLPWYQWYIAARDKADHIEAEWSGGGYHTCPYCGTKQKVQGSNTRCISCGGDVLNAHVVGAS
jgi:hypothetical protein